MKEGFRQCTSWLHTWTGLVVGWVLFFVFVTGTAGYFQYEITRWMQPERPFASRPEPVDNARAVALATARLQQVAPVAASWSITLPHASPVTRQWQDFSIRWESMPQPGHEFGAQVSERLDPVSGVVLPTGPEPRATSGGNTLYRMHYMLHYMPYEVAIRIVGVCTMLMLLAIVTGVITHKKIFKDFFTFRPGKGQRSWLDAHNAVSVMALPFFLMITYSGLVFFLYTYMPAGRDVLFGSSPAQQDAFFEELFEEGHKHAAIGMPAALLAPLLAQAEAAWGADRVRSITIERHEGEAPEIVISPVQDSRLDFWNPPTLRFHAETGTALAPEGEHGGGAVKTQSVMFNLHEGLFADIWGRWVYFVAGLLGCVMIGTGLVLWTVKRRKRHLGTDQGPAEAFGVRLVETLNVATLAGLPLAVAGYFWANRLLPVALADRAAWEVHSLFALWLASLFYAMARPLHRSWIELLWITCVAYALLPLLNALTTDKHLFNSLAQRDWVLAGVDLTLWALAATFALMAHKVSRKLAPARAETTAAAAAAAAKPVNKSSLGRAA